MCRYPKRAERSDPERRRLCSALPVRLPAPFLIAFAAALLLSRAAGVAAQPAEGEDQTTRPAYQMLRQNEDWSALRNPALRSDYLDPVKYVALGEASYLSLGGEIRSYYQYFDEEGWGQVEGADGYLLQRFMAHADLHLGSRLRLFAQLESGLVAERRAPARPADADDLDLNQGFAEVALGPRRRGAGTYPLALRLGRQELHYGAGRMISAREIPNTRRGFDGALARLRVSGWTADAFFLLPTETEEGVFDNGWIEREDEREKLWGAYLLRDQIVAPGGVPLRLDLYYFGTRKEAQPFAQGTGEETRHTVGLRPHLGGERLRADLEATAQFGPFETDDTGREGRIRTWSLSTSLSYAFPDVPLRPAPGLFIGLTSGDRDAADLDLETFQAPYPPARYSGPGNPLGPSNLLWGRPNLNLHFTSSLLLSSGVFVFWRTRLEDGVYAPSGALLRAPDESRARYVGAMPEALLTWQATRHLTVIGEASYFATGAFLEETPPGRDFTYFAARFTYLF